MIYQNIEIYNCAELREDPETGLKRMYRVPCALHDALNTASTNNCGVELRFVPLDDEVRVTLRAPEGMNGRAYIYYGGVQGGYPRHFRNFTDQGTEIVIPKPNNEEFLARVTAEHRLPFSPRVVRVLLENSINEIGDVKGACRPPEADEVPRRTVLCYGSSITHGSMALLPMNYYAFRIGEELRADVRNLGLAGHAFLEPELADYIAGIPFDAATLEMGVNLLSRIEADELARRVRYFVPKIAAGHPSKPIFCTDLYYINHDLMGDSDKPAAFRRAVRDTLLELDLPDVHFIPGLELLPDALLTQDGVHPSARGAETIAMNWARVLREQAGL